MITLTRTLFLFYLQLRNCVDHFPLEGQSMLWRRLFRVTLKVGVVMFNYVYHEQLITDNIVPIEMTCRQHIFRWMFKHPCKYVREFPTLRNKHLRHTHRFDWK